MSSDTSTIGYTIRRATVRPESQGRWIGRAWKDAETLTIERFHSRSSDHRPLTQAKALYDERALYVIFRVEDRYVRSVETAHNAMVCHDSCVEFFVQPKRDKGYFNFEVNCGGTLHLSYVEDPTRVPGGFAKCTPVLESVASPIGIYHSLPRVISNESPEPVEWRIEYAVPYTVFETYTGPIGDPAGQTWRGNFYKCADQTSHPHWATWAPLGEELNFHQPQYFAPLHFE